MLINFVEYFKMISVEFIITQINTIQKNLGLQSLNNENYEKTLCLKDIIMSVKSLHEMAQLKCKLVKKFHIKVDISVHVSRAIKLLTVVMFTTLGNAAEKPTDSFSYASKQTCLEQTTVLEGPTGVSRQLNENENLDTIQGYIPLIQSFADWKDLLEEKYGITFGLEASMLYQKAQKVLHHKDDDAASMLYRFQGTWKVFDMENGHTGRIEWRVENRSALASWQSPSELSSSIGMYSLNSGFTYNDSFDTDLAVINWTQIFENRGGFAIGRLAFDVYLDDFLFQTYSRAFINRSFIYNPAMPTTGVGALGAVVKGFISDNILIGAQIYDANAVSGKFDIDTFKQHEWLKAIEIAWTPSISQYKVDRIKLTYWQNDERKKAGVKEGRGWAISASHQFSDKLIPFFRFGHNDGGGGVVAKSAASMGFEFHTKKGHAWSLGAGWADPTINTYGEKLKDEYVFETSYRVQVTPSISLTPDIQLLLNPSNNQSVNSVWVLGLRIIITL